MKHEGLWPKANGLSITAKIVTDDDGDDDDDDDDDDGDDVCDDDVVFVDDGRHVEAHRPFQAFRLHRSLAA